MMAELTTTKLNPESHLLLDQPLLRVPYELSRKNFKTAQRLIERDRDAILPAINSATSLSIQIASQQGEYDSQQQTPTVASLDKLIERAEGLKRKLETLHTEEKTLHKQSRERILHLEALYNMHSLTDVKYEQWSQVRLSRMLVDYLLRNGYGESAKALAREKGVEDLVDVEAFVQCHRIEESLRQGKTGEALTWCADNKQSLRKINSQLEFQLRLQQFIELVRIGTPDKASEAVAHAIKYLSHPSNYAQSVQASALLAFPAGTRPQPYANLYAAQRWSDLANLFLKTHHELLSLPPTPQLHVALSAGLSALKTPSCHSKHISPSTSVRVTTTNTTNNMAAASASNNTPSHTSAVGTSVCPICSTELNELARSVPYALHSKSIVEHDPVVLPSKRIYGRERLERWNEKMGMPVGCGRVKDPSDPSLEFGKDEVKKVYIL